jgi:hypothetical protein
MGSPEKNFPLLMWYKLFYESHSQHEGSIPVDQFLPLETSIPVTVVGFFLINNPGIL